MPRILAALPSLALVSWDLGFCLTPVERMSPV